ncbi:MAG: hypothetical protein ACREUZ_18985, partial [Burkholderiales bacterium]
MAPLRRESRGSIRPQISWLYYAAIEMALCGRELTAAPKSVETALCVEEEPIADAGRYDRLRKETDHA